MARLQIGEDRVQRLVNRSLVPLFFQYGSVNAASDALNDALQGEAKGKRVYPNRLHTLLSDDLGRGVNESTVESIEEAIRRILERTGDFADSPAVANLCEPVLREWRAGSEIGENIQGISKRLALPPAVVRCVLQRAGRIPQEYPRGLAYGKDRREEQQASPVPDWSFQDVAFLRCMEALQQKSGRKVGLVIPTGGGKTRLALRIALHFSKISGDVGKVVWVTHLRNLRAQAHRELQEMLSEGVEDIPDDAAELLVKRIDFIMVSRLEQYLRDPEVVPVLVIVDEAHHAAASSYQPIFETPYALSGLFLTATPNRTDGLPIGIDEIAFYTTFRELSERRVVVMPTFEELPVEDFDWSEKDLQNLADYVIDRSATDYRKTLVIAPTTDRVEDFYQALVDRLSEAQGHPLELDDIGYLHSKRNSLGTDADSFLASFSGKPRGIIVSAKMLLEGFNDPAINAVVITYPSASIIVLMQAAGRAVRSSPGKRQAYVLQAKNEALAYHFDHRWLYQEISDYLRPELIDVDYTDLHELRVLLKSLLESHNVNPSIRRHLLDKLGHVAPGETCRVLLSGLPFFGPQEQFSGRSTWSAILETTSNHTAFRTLFNRFSQMGAGASDPMPFMQRFGSQAGIVKDASQSGEYRRYIDMLMAMNNAQKEIYDGGVGVAGGEHRPFERNRSTTWLKYITFRYRPAVPSELEVFLDDCYNRDDVLRYYIQDPQSYALSIKLRLPLEGFEGFILTFEEAQSFCQVRHDVLSKLLTASPGEQFAVLAAYLARSSAVSIPPRVLARIESFLSQEQFDSQTLQLAATP
jgi:superfamily II DNA or RNA helicase